MRLFFFIKKRSYISFDILIIIYVRIIKLIILILYTYYYYSYYLLKINKSYWHPFTNHTLTYIYIYDWHTPDQSHIYNVWYMFIYLKNK